MNFTPERKELQLNMWEPSLLRSTMNWFGYLFKYCMCNPCKQCSACNVADFNPDLLLVCWRKAMGQTRSILWFEIKHVVMTEDFSLCLTNSRSLEFTRKKKGIGTRANGDLISKHLLVRKYILRVAAKCILTCDQLDWQINISCRISRLGKI